MNNAGRIGFLIKDDYDPAVSYDFLDVVFYDGASYVAKKLTVGNTPARNNEYWHILAEGGTLTENSDISNTIVTFQMAENKVNLTSGEETSALVGKIAAYLNDLKNVSFSAKYGDLLETPENVSEFENDAKYLTEGDLKPNTSTDGGYVTASEGRAEEVWKTDADGNPGWRPGIKQMEGATEEKAGKSGTVPIPGAGMHQAVLQGDGTWINLGAAAYANVANDAETTEENSLLDARMGPVFQEQIDILNLFREFILNPLNKNANIRGKNLGTAVTPEQITAIRDGSFEDIWLGDYWEINGKKYRIWDFNYWLHCGDTAFEKNHVLILPDRNLYNQRMNATNITTGGYIGSEMYKTGLAAAKTEIANAFGDMVLSHRELLTNAVANGIPTAGAWVDSTIELPNEVMMYGSYHHMPANNGAAIPYRYTINKSQLALAQLCPEFITTRENYWLRDVVSASNFARVYDLGHSGTTGASSSFGVRPVFCIG